MTEAIYRVRPDAFFVRDDDGVWLRNSQGSFSIRGKGSYELVHALFTGLDGQRPVTEIYPDLPEKTARSVAAVLETLHRNGFVREVPADDEPLPEGLAQRYPEHLAFLGQHLDRPAAGFLRMRAATVLCVGAGLALRSLLDALGELGVAAVRVLLTDDDRDGTAAQIVRDRVALDPQADWSLRRIPADAAATEVAAASADAVLVADESATPEDVAGMLVEARPTGVLAPCGDLLVAGMLTDTVCWQCVHRSVADRVRAGAGLDAAATQVTIAALHLAQRVFAELAGLDRDNVFVSVEPLAPVVATHTVYPHPVCGHPAPPAPARVSADERVRPDVPDTAEDAEIVAIHDRIVGVCTEWTDRRVGPLLSLGESDSDQLPLSGSVCRVLEPHSRAGRVSEWTVECRTIAPREARNQVVLCALARLGRALDPDGSPVGAGWTPAEAAYRAHLAAAESDDVVRIVADTGPETGAVHGFLADAVHARFGGWTSEGFELLVGGMSRARVRAGGASAVGHGVDLGHALDNALLALLADGADAGHLAPPVGSWQQALDRLDGDTRDVSARLPFLGGRAFLATREPR